MAIHIRAVSSLQLHDTVIFAEKMELENLNPDVYKKSDDRKSVAADWDDSVDDPFDEREIFGNTINK